MENADRHESAVSTMGFRPLPDHPGVNGAAGKEIPFFKRKQLFFQGNSGR
jgi:hypothetical protein